MDEKIKDILYKENKSITEINNLFMELDKGILTSKINKKLKNELTDITTVLASDFANHYSKIKINKEMTFD